jgi:hypothetical protein
MSMPDKATLEAALNQQFQLRAPTGETFNAELVKVGDGMALNKRYVCYAAEFALPEGLKLPQETYEITNAANDSAWSLLLVPIIPGDDGRALLEAIFHVEAKP